MAIRFMRTSQRHGAGNGVRFVSAREGAQALDRQARKYLNMSGGEFVRRYQAGQIPDPDRPEVIRLAMLMRYAEQ